MKFYLTLIIVGIALLLGAEDASAAIVPPTLNWDAALDAPGNNFWDSTVNATNARRWNFGSGRSPGGVSDPVFQVLSKAYSPAASTMNSFEGLGFGGTNPTQQSATFEWVFQAAGSDLGSGVQRVVMESGGDGDGIALMLLDGDLVFRVQQYNPGGGNNGIPNHNGDVLAQPSTLFPADGRFHQVVGTIDLPNNQVSLYLDGTLVDQATTLIQNPGGSFGNPGNLTDWAGGNAAGLGRTNSSIAGNSEIGGPFTNLAGSVAIVRYYRNQVFTADQVIQNFYALVPEPGTLLVWSLVAALGVAAGWRNTRRRRRL